MSYLSHTKTKSEKLYSALDRTLAIVMGGGKGSRLYPLTKERAKPAVPLAGKYRLVDIPLSNCINSGIHDIYVLTQFNSMSLNRHITNTYKFDNFRSGFVEVIAAQQTLTDERWFQGTADAVRQSLEFISEHRYDYFLILSGDQLYTENMAEIIKCHLKNSAEITISTIPVERDRAQSLGIMQVDEKGKIVRFVEKPKTDAELENLDISGVENLPENLVQNIKLKKNYLASMGIYFFNAETLYKVLDNDFTDFGKDIIPQAINEHEVFYYPFVGAWEDIGTIGAFFEANLNLTRLVPDYNFFNSLAPFFTNARFLPASKVNGAAIDHALISDGCIITDAVIRQSIIGVRSIINHGSTVERSIVMGTDYYESELEAAGKYNPSIPPIGIGSGTTIKQAIIDKNSRIGNNVTITPYGKPAEMDGENFYIRDGIVVIRRSSIIPDNTVI